MIGRRQGLRRARSRVGSRIFAPEMLESRQLLATFSVTNTADTGAGSLRAAITSANQTAGGDRIVFNIVAAGVQTIQLATPLPPVLDTLEIDGTTQPGYAGSPRVALNGTNAGAAAIGLQLQAATTVKALAINNFGGEGIRIQSSGSVIQTSYIGINPAGTAAAANASGIVVGAGTSALIGGDGLGNVVSGNTGHGIRVEGNNTRGTRIQGNRIGTSADGSAAVKNGMDGINVSFAGGILIGGLNPGQRNIISGNGIRGISIFQSQVPNAIQNNYIGTNRQGTAAVPNGGDGIQLFTEGDTLGGTVPEARNLISGNNGKGVQLFGADQSVVQGNWIGVAVDGTTALGNKDAGIGIQGTDDALIGGTLPGASNLIAYNGTAAFQQGGINIFSGLRNTIRSNEIHDNIGRGIRFFTVDSQPPPNDPGDPDSGPNSLQNYPELLLAGAGSGRTRVRGTLNSAPNTTFTLEFFSNAAPDPSGFGEGQLPIGTVTVVTSASGTALLDLTLPVEVASGRYITATATDLAGNTSEFSNAVSVTATDVVDLAVSRPGPGGTSEFGTLGQPITYTVSARNNGPDTANNVEIVDLVPNGFQIQSVSLAGTGTYTQVGNLITATLPQLAAGEQASLTVTLLPVATGQFTNTVTVSSREEIDSDITNNAVTWTTAIARPADLALNIQADLEPGQTSSLVTDPITYLVSVANTNVSMPGVGTATGVTLDIELPNDVMILYYATGQGTVRQSGNRLIASFPTLPVGTPAAVLVIVQPTQAGTTSITATASANEADANPADNTQTLTLPVLAATDLSLVMSADTTQVLAGQKVTFNLRAENKGPSAASGVVVVNDLPAGLEFSDAFSSQGTVSHSGQQVTVNLGDLAFGEVASITIEAIARATANVTNTASISSDIADQDTTNNTAIVDLTLDPADIGIEVTTSPANPALGETLSYVVTVTNDGPATATDAVITNTLSPLVTFQGAWLNGVAISATPVNGVLTVNLDPLAVYDDATLRIDVVPNQLGVLNHVATVTATQADPTPGNNTASDVSVVNAADIAVSIDGPQGDIAQGTPKTYRVTVRNNGPRGASNFNVEAGLPTGADLVSATAGANVASLTQDGDTLTALIGQLGSGQTAHFTFVLRPTTVGTLTVSAGYNPGSSNHIDTDPGNNSASVSNTVVNLPGVLQFSQSVFQTNDNAGSLTIKVVRTGGTQGTLTADYHTVAGTAQPNVNFTPVSGTLTFYDGEFEQFITIPILSDGEVTGSKTFSLVLEGSALGAQKTAQIYMAETDVDLTGPQVTNIQLVGAGAVTGYILSFNEQLAAGPAQTLSNYVVYLGSNPNRPVAARRAVYNDAARTVTITLASPLPAGTFHKIIVNGTAPKGLTDRFGNLLDGNADGQVGGNFVVSYARARNLTYTDGNGDRVNLNLRGPGNIEVLRGGNGDAQLVRLPGGNTSSTLSGSVRRQNGRGDGITNLGRVENLGAFQGGVRSRLTSPPFYADNTPALLPSSAARALAASRAALRRAFRTR